MGMEGRNSPWYVEPGSDKEKEMDRIRLLNKTLKDLRSRIRSFAEEKGIIEISSLEPKKDPNGSSSQIKLRYGKVYEEKITSFLESESKLIDGLLAQHGGGSVEIKKKILTGIPNPSFKPDSDLREIAEEIFGPLVEVTITITD